MLPRSLLFCPRTIFGWRLRDAGDETLRLLGDADLAGDLLRARLLVVVGAAAVVFVVARFLGDGLLVVDTGRARFVAVERGGIYSSPSSSAVLVSNVLGL